MSFRNTRIFLITITAVALAWSLPASAEVNGADAADSPWYIGVTMTNGTYTVENVIEADINTFDFRLGREFNDYFSVEGRLGLGFNDSDVSGCEYVEGELVCSQARVRVTEYVGLYGRGYFIPEGMFRPYAVAGYASGTTAIALNSVSSNETKRTTSGLSYGLGLEVGGDTFGFTAEYLSLFDKDSESVDGMNFGVTIKF